MARKVCEVCGTYDGTPHRNDCPFAANGGTYSVWIYGPKIGWWLQEEGYDNLDDAGASLAELIRGNREWTGGAIVPAGPFPMPMCNECFRAGRIHHPPAKGKGKTVRKAVRK